MSGGADVLVAADAESVFSAIRRGTRENRLLAIGMLIALAIVVVGLLAPVLAPSAPDVTHPLQTLQAPSAAHWFGTDQLGRDLYSRVLFGTRISPVIAFLVLAISCGVGIPLGIVAGYYGGLVDEVIMRITDVFLAFPALLLALALAAVLPPSLGSVTLAVSVTWWPWYTRLVRGQAASVAGRPFVEGAKASGVSDLRILLRHVLPNSLTPLVVQVSLDVSAVILTVSALSFLGLGAQDPTPEWGLMVSQGQLYFPGQWWLVTFPGLAIVITAVAFNLLGDGLRDVLDPRRVVPTR
jgi:peptide/nickel transport system permease protein